MGTVTKHYCDMCGKEVKALKDFRYGDVEIVRGYAIHYHGREVPPPRMEAKAELCKSCFRHLFHTIGAMINDKD